MKWITRFNPTISGSELHVGHLYVALVNAVEAHKSGGKFIVRIDDNQPYWIWKLGAKTIQEIGERFIEQLDHFVNIDAVSWQSKLPEQKEVLPHPINEYVREWFLHGTIAEWIPNPDTALYPYAPKFTLDRAFLDFYEGVNWLIRGDDLVSESTLYCFFVDVMGFPEVKQTYLPRLRARDNNELHVTTISKTFRNYQLDKQIKEFGISTVIEFLEQSCLKDTDKDFTVDNIKCNPTIVGFIE